MDLKIQTEVTSTGHNVWSVNAAVLRSDSEFIKNYGIDVEAEITNKLSYELSLAIRKEAKRINTQLRKKKIDNIFS